MQNPYANQSTPSTTNPYAGNTAAPAAAPNTPPFATIVTDPSAPYNTYESQQSFSPVGLHNVGNQWRSDSLKNNIRIEVSEIIFLDSGKFNQMYYRPYEINAGQDDTNNLLEAIERNGRVYSPSTIARTIGHTMAPSAHATQATNIANGYDTERTLFIITLKSKASELSNEQITIIHGYAESNMLGGRVSGGTSGNIDPTMNLYINGFMTMCDVAQMDRNNRPFKRRILNERISVAHGVFSNSRGHTVDPVTMRPVDVFNTLSRDNLANHYSLDNVSAHNTINDLAKMQCIPMVRQDTSPTNMLYTTLSALNLSATRNHGNFLHGFSDSADSTNVSAMDVNPFFSKLRAHRAAATNSLHYFTMHELQQIAGRLPTPNYYTRGEIRNRDQKFIEASQNNGINVAVPFGDYRNVESWNQAGIESYIASMLDNLLPEAMLGHSMMVANINAVYTPERGIWHVMCSGRMMGGIDGVDVYNSLSIHLATYVLPMISMRNGSGQMPIAITAYKDLFSISRYEISYNNQPVTPFESPTYADGIYNASIAHSDSFVTALAHKAEMISNEIIGAFGNTNPNAAVDGQAMGGFGLKGL